MSETPELSKASFVFTQDGNTVGTTSDIEMLEINLETQLPGEEPFIVIKSETGWSVDNLIELTSLIEKCRIKIP